MKAVALGNLLRIIVDLQGNGGGTNEIADGPDLTLDPRRASVSLRSVARVLCQPDQPFTD